MIDFVSLLFAWIQEMCLVNPKSGDADATHVDELDSPDSLLCHHDSVLSNTVSGLLENFCCRLCICLPSRIFLLGDFNFSAHSIFFAAKRKEQNTPHKKKERELQQKIRGTLYYLKLKLIKGQEIT